MRGVIALLSAGALCPSAAAQDSYLLHRAGLYGPEFTSQAGTRNVAAQRLRTTGVVTGRSERFAGGVTSLGFAAWRYEDAATIRLGYTDADHTSPEGAQNSFIAGLNDAGDVVGTSTRYQGTTLASTAWLYRAGVLTQLGLTGPDFTSPTGLSFSGVSALNAAGQVIGGTTRYFSSGATGTAGWLFDQGAYTPLGLTDPEHTSSTGVQNTFARFLSDAGDAAGNSSRYTGPSTAGTSAWLRRAGVTARVGFYDAEHTSPTGGKWSSAWGLTAGGLAVGTSDRFVGNLGTAAWVADMTSTTRIGLLDAEHTALDGHQLSEPIAWNASGHVIGRSFRFPQGSTNGESAWIFRDGATTRIGLFGPAQTGSNGFQYSRARQMNSRGDVLGESTWFVPIGTGGRMIWVFSEGTNRRVGLFDPSHTDSNGRQDSLAVHLNNRGDAIGTSIMYAGAFLGTSGWYYDRASDITVPLIFSLSPNGTASTSPAVVTDEGLVYGSYTRFDGPSPGTYAFRWSMAGGLEDLHLLVDGGLAGAGWDRLHQVYGDQVPGTVDSRTIVGVGRQAGQSQNSVFVLTAGRCTSGDFDCDGDFHTDADIEAFFACLAGSCPPPPCPSSADFNGDGDSGSDSDVEAFFRVLAGGRC